MTFALNLLWKYQQQYGSNFDTTAFMDAAAKGNAASLNPDDFLKDRLKKNAPEKIDDKDKNKDKNKDKDKDKDKKKDDGKPKIGGGNGGYNLDFSNGQCTAEGFGSHAGQDLAAGNPRAMFMLICKNFNAEFDRENLPPEERITELSIPPHDKNYEKITRAAFKASVDSNIILAGSLPKDKAFYAQLKQDFMKNPKHTEKDWARLTSFVPPKYLPRDAEKDKNANKTAIRPDVLAAKRARTGR